MYSRQRFPRFNYMFAMQYNNAIQYWRPSGCRREPAAMDVPRRLLLDCKSPGRFFNLFHGGAAGGNDRGMDVRGWGSRGKGCPGMRGSRVRRGPGRGVPGAAGRLCGPSRGRGAAPLRPGAVVPAQPGPSPRVPAAAEPVSPGAGRGEPRTGDTHTPGEPAPPSA